MDAILAPWLARADALCPQWRDVMHGGHLRVVELEIDLIIKHSVYKADELLEFFRLVHGFRDHADVCIRLQMCQDMQRTVDLGDWKLLFDLISRKTFPIPSQSDSDQQRKKKWDLLVSCGGHGLDNDPECGQDRWHVVTDARLVAACFSALAHAGDHVTSVCLVNPLEDKTSDYREPRDRSTCAEWLGYLLRYDVVENLALDERKLTTDNLDIIASILEAPMRADCFRMLWKKRWSRPCEALQ